MQDSNEKYCESITAHLRFLKAEAVYSETLKEINSSDSLNSQCFEDVSIKIYNGRSNLLNFSIDKEGFILYKHSSKIDNFFDDEQIDRIYTSEVELLLRKITGCDTVLVFNHTRRSSDPSNSVLNKPAITVHNDFTEQSMRKKLQDFVDQKGINLDIDSFKRLSILIVWRSCKGEITSYPLALCDATTINKKQIKPIFRISGLGKNEVQLAANNLKNKWYYFPKMKMDEALIFRSADSGLDAQEIGVIHSAIRLQSEEDTYTPRISLESRCFVLFK